MANPEVPVKTSMRRADWFTAARWQGIESILNGFAMLLFALVLTSVLPSNPDADVLIIYMMPALLPLALAGFGAMMVSRGASRIRKTMDA